MRLENETEHKWGQGRMILKEIEITILLKMVPPVCLVIETLDIF